MNKNFFLFLIIIFSFGCATTKTNSPNKSISYSEKSFAVQSKNKEVSGICANLINQVVIAENVKLIGFSNQNGFLVESELKNEELGKSCIFSNDSVLEEYQKLPKASIKCYLGDFMLESNNYYVKFSEDGIIEMYNPEYKRYYITHSNVCTLIKQNPDISTKGEKDGK